MLTLTASNGDYEAHEVEDNNSTASADVLTSGSSIIGQLSSSSDVDYFSFDITEPGVWNINFDGPGSPYAFAYFDLRILDSVGNLLSSVTSWKDSNFNLGFQTPGTYYVAVASVPGPFSFDSGSYTLIATATDGTASNYEGKSNNTVETADQISLGAPIVGQLLSSSDIDYYAVSLDTATVLSIQATAEGDTAINQVTFSIYDPSGTLIANHDGALTSDNNLLVGANSPGVYYIKAWTHYDISNGPTASGFYSLAISTSDAAVANFESESNDTAASSDVIDISSPVSGQISAGVSSDTDYYKISLGNSGLFKLTFDAPDDYNWAFGVTLNDAAGNAIYSWNTGIDRVIQFLAPGSGDYYAAVTAFYGPTDQYTLRFDAAEGTYTDDYGNSSLTSGAIEIGKSVGGNIEVSGDSDWFKVDLEAGHLYSFPIVWSDGVQAPAKFRIFDTSGSIVADSESSNYFQPETNGSYYLAIDGDLGATGTYTVSVANATNDVTASVDTTGTLVVGNLTAGTVVSIADEDWYRVHLEAGQTYIFNASGTSQYAGGYDLNIGVQFTDGVQIEYVEDNPTFSWEVTANAELGFTAPSTGDYFVSVGGKHFAGVTVWPDAYQEYTLSANLQPVQDSVDALLSGYSWSPTSPLPHSTALTYSFPTALPTEYSSAYVWAGIPAPVFTSFTIDQKKDIRTILQSWSDVANVTFTETTGANGMIRFGWVAEDPYILGDAAAITYWDTPSATSTQITRADVFVSSNYFSPTQDPSAGDYLYLSLLHEIGHALTLDHTQDYGDGSPPPYLTPSLDNTNFSVMSYFDNADSSIYSSVPASFDIATVQYLFGANNTYNNGNDVYAYTAGTEYLTTLWDAGGTDTIDASDQTLASMIFLEGGTLSSIGATTMGAAAHDNVAIAFGAQIENAKGGSGNDLIIGNATTNTLSGAGGNDTLIGGADTDTAQYSGNRSGYSLSLSNGSYTITDINTSDGDDGTDTLTGIEQLVFADVTMNLGSNNSPTGNLVIDGSATQGQTLTAVNMLADLDDLGTFSYQWQSSSDSSNWNNLGTGPSLSLTQAQVDLQIRLVASYTDGFGTSESVTSSATVAVANINDAPLITSATAASIAENVPAGTVVYTLTATDPDAGQSVRYSLGGADANAFDFDAQSGQISFKASPNFEAKSSYSVSVTVMDDFIAEPLSTTQTVTIAVTDVATSRYTVLGGGASFLDFFSYGNLSLDGQEIVLKGNAGVDAVYVSSADNLQFDFTQAGLGIDKIYLAGRYADYATSHSGSVVTLTRTSGGSEAVKTISGDSLVFADGTVAVADVLGFLKTTAAEPVPSGEMSTVFPQAIPDGLSNTVRTVVLDAGGETIALARPGEDLLVKGGSGVDTVYVTPGSHVDATQLGLGQDKVYLAENLDDYSGSVAGNAVTLTRDVEGHSESVRLLGGSSSAYDSIVFSDGTAKSVDLLTHFNGGAAPVLDTLQITPTPLFAPSLIAGTAGNDLLTGTGGRNQLDGGAGTDTLTGLPGSDTFVLGHGYGGSTITTADIITDFTDGSDHIGLIGSLAFSDLVIAQGNGTDTATANTVISTSGEYLAVLLNISASLITQNDFQVLSA